MATRETRAQESAQDLLDELVEQGHETGLQVAAFLDGELVVNAYSGTADPASGRLVDEDTLFHGWSAGKGVTATAVHALAERGLLDYNAPIATYWPEFGTHGKGSATVLHALTHAAGVPQTPRGLADLRQLHRWDALCAAVAELEPLWPPGSATGYHAFTFGWILGQIVRQASGRDLDRVIRDDIAEPLGIPGALFCAVPEDALGRMARLTCTDAGAEPTPRPLLAVSPELGNNPEFLTATVPAVGTMTAYALARMYAALIGPVDGIRLVSQETATLISRVRTSEVDRVLGRPIPKSLGYVNDCPGSAGLRSTAFGMPGAGGSCGFADPEHGFAFALMKNRMNGPDPTTRDTVESVSHRIRRALGIPDESHR